jgi:hypothetical protein
MKKLMAIAFALCLVATMSSMAFAQAEPHDVGVFADAAGTMTALTATPFVTTNFYVVGFELDGQVKGFEYGLNVPAGTTVISVVFLGPNPLLVGTNTNVAVGTGGCVDGSGAAVLANYSVVFLDATATDGTQAICMGPSDPSSLGGVPAYLQCDGTILPMGYAENGASIGIDDGCMTINGESPLPAETTSFSEVKARF